MNSYREYRNREEMIERGWKVETSTALCNRCGAEINWSTSPNGKKLPLDTNSTQPHFKSCANDGAAPTAHQQPAASASSDSPDLIRSVGELVTAVRQLCSILRDNMK